ncbi:MAG: histidinol-phosphatase HisJ family protein [Desulfobacteraceae bacterium]|nr:histidinol-phosphatase HisJ family protein [Desulfobacteraceae bacterium]
MDFVSVPDYHIHTVLCKHAERDVSDYKRAAQRHEITEICFSDHGPNPDGYDPRHRMEMRQFPSYKQMVTSLQDSNPPVVLFGIETDFYEGCEKFLGEWLPRQGFDLVIGSVHYIEGWGFDNPSERHVWDSVDVADTWRKYFDLVGRMADSGLFDAVGHLDLPKKFGYRPPDKAIKEIVQPALDRIARAAMGIELNTSGLRKTVGEIYPSPLIVSLAREREIPICFGSDSHTPEDIGAGFDLALGLASEAGYKSHFRICQRSMELTPLPRSADQEKGDPQ